MRKDQWTVDDDKILADTVLSFIREGKTQIEAFNHASTVLERTKQACGFRWNKTLRRNYHIQKIKRPVPSEIQSHLYQAMNSYDNLSIAYEKLKVEHEKLYAQQEKIKDWLSNGKELFTIS